MDREIRAALLAQTEARQAHNALPEDAPEADVTAARAKVAEADQAVTELLAKEESSAPAELRDRISLARYMVGIVKQRQLDGAEAELNKELNIRDEQFPLEALLPTVEERADAVSPQNAAGQPLAFGDVNTTTGPMLQRVFTQTDAAFLGVAMPTVPPGERVYPVMVDGTSASMQARGGEPDAGAAKFSIVNATPHRLTARYLFDLEGVAELGGLLEATLRSDLRMAMGYQLDREILNGDGAGAEIDGIINSLDLEVPPGLTLSSSKDVSAALTWANGKQIGTDGLDGKFSRMESDLRMLIGGATYTQARALYRNDQAGDSDDLISAWRALGMRVQRSFQIAGPGNPTLKGGNAKTTKKVQSAVVNSEPGAAVAPVWQGISLIRDPYTNAGKAQIALTSHMLYDFVFRRKDGWHQYAIRTEA